MTDHGEQPRDPRRAPEQSAGVGRSFAEVWGTVAPVAAPGGATAAPAAQGEDDREASPPAVTPTAGETAGELATPSEALSVTVSRPLSIASSAPDVTSERVGDRLTVEVRREGGRSNLGRPREQITVTVSRNGVDEQLAVTL